MVGCPSSETSTEVISEYIIIEIRLLCIFLEFIVKKTVNSCIHRSR
jgi:hypothetical protein